MFRHMSVPRDTSVLHVHEIIIVCCESVGNCPTLSKVGPSQLVNNITFCPFFLLFASDGPRFLYLFLSRSEVRPPRVLYSSLYHVIFSHVTVFSVFIGKSTVELCDPQCEF